MSSTITTSVVTGGTNSKATTTQEINYPVTDFVNDGVVGTISLNAGSGGTGAFAVNAQATPAMFVDVTAGAAYITATPSGQSSQTLRANMASDYTSYAISSNSSGSTKYDWIYLKVDATAANNPASDASDVTSLYTSRSSSATADDGSPPTYGLLLAVVTVANGASSIANSAISDQRTDASLVSTSSTTYFFDFVESGCVWTADSAGSTLNASMTSGVIWISGVRLTVSSVSARAFTASKDTYIDLSDNGDGAAAFTYTTVTNNAASPALATGALRIGIIVTGASSIADSGSINQGQMNKQLPIASSVAYTVSDSLGNLICPRDSQRRLLCQRRMAAAQSAVGTTITQITGLSCPVIVPSGRSVKITVFLTDLLPSTAFDTNSVYIYDGSVASGTVLNYTTMVPPSGGTTEFFQITEHVTTPTSTSKTYNGAIKNHGAGGAKTVISYSGAGGTTSWMKVELL